MLNSKSFLAVDFFGAGSLKLAEFEVIRSRGPAPEQYAVKPLGAQGAQESTREATVLKALQEIIAERGIKSKVVNVCAPGFHVFSKFVKLLRWMRGRSSRSSNMRRGRMCRSRSKRWSGTTRFWGRRRGGELEVLLVAIKADIVEGLFRITETSGLHLQLTDVSPAALCNAFRYNYGELEDCTMLLDIGAKTSNLLFFEKGKMYARSINLGANSITQDFANESKLKYDVAEKLKIDEGFVSLGGAYEEPENPHQAAISKIARQFMTRLHIQVNQTLQFYRGQQGGSAPVRLFLSGGASVMPYTAQFFAEKLNVPVEYFNPLRNVQIDPSINLEELARVAHSLGEVVGLGLRNLAHCPVELNLMPASTLKWQSFNQKKPYFIASVFSLVLVIAAVGLLFDKLAKLKNDALEAVHREVQPKQVKSEQFKRAYNELKRIKADADQLSEWLNDRFYWADVLSELRQVLIRVQSGLEAKLRADAGVWIEQFITTAPAASPDTMGFNVGIPEMPSRTPEDLAALSAEQEMFRRRYGLPGGRGPVVPPAEMPSVPTPEMPAPPPMEMPMDPNNPMAPDATGMAAGRRATRTRFRR
jgi:type IV pilus assembly protein PilM